MCGTRSTHGRNEKLMLNFCPPPPKKKTKGGDPLVDVDVDVRITLSVWVEFLWNYAWACAEVCVIQRMEITSNLKYNKDKKI